MRYTLDTPIDDLEFSVRTINVLKAHGCATLRDAGAKLEQLKGHARGFGSKSYREVKEAVQYASATQGDLLEDTEYRRYLYGDRMQSAFALMQDVHGTLMRAAMAGRLSNEGRRQMAFKLRDAAAFVDQIPTGPTP